MSMEPPRVQPSNEPPPVARPAVRAKSTRMMDLIENRWVMLLMLFGVTAALGLPFLWKAKSFSRGEKIFWSVVVSLYTILILWIFFKIMAWCYNSISQSLQIW